MLSLRGYPGTRSTEEKKTKKEMKANGDSRSQVKRKWAIRLAVIPRFCVNLGSSHTQQDDYTIPNATPDCRLEPVLAQPSSPT